MEDPNTRMESASWRRGHIGSSTSHFYQQVPCDHFVPVLSRNPQRTRSGRFQLWFQVSSWQLALAHTFRLLKLTDAAGAIERSCRLIAWDRIPTACFMLFLIM